MSSEAIKKSNKPQDSLLEFVKENNRKYLEEKKLKYGFDFSADESPATLIYCKPILKTEETKEYPKPPEVNFENMNFIFEDRKALKKMLREKYKESFKNKDKRFTLIE